MHEAVHINICYESIAMLSYLWWILYLKTEIEDQHFIKFFFLIDCSPSKVRIHTKYPKRY